MNASHNLLTLVSQLQSMEASIGTIIFETVAKLASLTSSSVFLMLETDGARRFGGSPHLCDAFVGGGGLSVAPKDLRVEVDLNLRCSVETPAAPFENPASGMTAFPGCALQFSAFPPPSNSDSPKNGGGGGAGVFPKRNKAPPTRRAPAADSGASPSKKFKPADIEIKEEAPEVKTEVSVDAAAPSSAEQQKQNCVVLRDEGLFDDDGDSDVEILESIFEVSADDNEADVGGGFNSALDFADSSPMSSSMTTATTMALDQSSSVVSQIPCNQRKVEALRSIQDPMRAFQKENAECRLLSSVFYDFGKELAKMSPLGDLQPTAFFKSSVDLITREFPNLFGRPSKIDVGAHKYTLTAFARMAARNGFKHYLARRLKLRDGGRVSNRD